MTSERNDLVALAEQWDRDAEGCDRDGYQDAGVVKRDCARRLRELARRLQPARVPSPEWVQSLRREVLLSAMKTTFSLTRDELAFLLAAAPEPKPAALADENLPGMWERADLIGGKTDCLEAAAAPAPEAPKCDACGDAGYTVRPSGSHTCWKCKPEADHSCRNCLGVDPASCVFNHKAETAKGEAHGDSLHVGEGRVVDRENVRSMNYQLWMDGAGGIEPPKEWADGYWHALSRIAVHPTPEAPAAGQGVYLKTPLAQSLKAIRERSPQEDRVPAEQIIGQCEGREGVDWITEEMTGAHLIDQVRMRAQFGRIEDDEIVAVLGIALRRLASARKGEGDEWLSGDWRVSGDAQHIFNSNFDTDVMLALSGDFEGCQHRHDVANAIVRRLSSAQQPGEWRCFHCDERFTDKDAAALHFGTHEYQEPACLIDIAKYREMEALQLRYADEDACVHRTMRRMETDHQQALRRAEEDGYAKGLADAAKYPEEVATLTQRTDSRGGEGVGDG
jgi:hypothetical protein